MPDRRPRLAVVSAELPTRQSPSGFAARLHGFLQAARGEAEVALAYVDLAGSTSPAALDRAPADIVRRFAAPPAVWRRPGVRGQLLRGAVQYPLDPLPYHCYPRRAPELRAWLRELRPDAVVLYLPYLAHLTGHCPPGVPVVAVLEEPWEWVVAAAVGRSRKDAWLARRETTRFRRLYRRLNDGARAVVAISEEERRYFAAMIDPTRIAVIPHGIDPDYFRPAAAREHDIDVLVVGRLTAPNNLEGALRAWEAARARPESARWRWGFVGAIDGSVAERLRAAGGLVTGPVPDVRPFYARARAVLVPALSGRGVKTTSLQAWAMARPLVCSAVGAQGLPVEPGVNAMVGAEPEDMVDCLHRLLSDPAMAERVAGAGRRTVERERDLRRLAAQFAELCREVASRG